MRIVLFLIVLAAFVACTDSDKYLYNAEPESISVSAYMTRSFDSTATQGRADTISPGDSIIFLSTILPSKSIWNRKYYWTVDGAPFANEYNFKSTVTEPGIHKIAFVFIDYFGDTLSDTLSLSVASPPELDEDHFIPAAGTQQIDPNQFVHFAWNAYDPDDTWDLYYHFVLQEKNCTNPDSCKVLVDTILTQPTFSYLNGFSPLKEYGWTVSAYNEMEQAAAQKISSNFYVKGHNNESAIFGKIKTNSYAKQPTVLITLTDLQQDTCKTLKTDESFFSISPLPQGKYTLYISTPDAPDFKGDSVNISLQENQIVSLDSLLLQDFKGPIITVLSNRDSLYPLDTLLFHIYDNGSGLNENKILVYLDGKSVTSSSLSNDTLMVIADIPEGTWTAKFIVIEAYDMSGNRSRRAFYIRPKTNLGGVYSE